MKTIRTDPAGTCPAAGHVSGIPPSTATRPNPGRGNPCPLTRHIQLNLKDIDQLFNTIDPSPFPEKDLDRGVEDFIVSWTEEFSIEDPVDLIVHFKTFHEGDRVQPMLAAAIHHYFLYRARLNQLEFRRLMRQGRTSLVVGILFLSACLFLSGVLIPHRDDVLSNFLREGLTIAGWVAMWRPMEIYLYEWWPLQRRGKIFKKLSRISVKVRKGAESDFNSSLPPG